MSLSVRRHLPVLLIVLAFLAVAYSTTLLISYVGSNSFEDWRLVFLQFESRTRWIGLSVACALAVGCIATLFRYEQELISRRLGLVLLCLRLSLILILFLTLLEPVWTWSFDEENQGRVVVALDASASMDTKDWHAPDAEKLHWARAVGILGNDENTAQYDRWQAALDAGEEPEWVTAEEVADPAQRKRQAAVRKQSFQDLMAGVEKLSRWEIVSRAVTADSNALFNELSELAVTEMTLFGGDFSGIGVDSRVNNLEQNLQAARDNINQNLSDFTQPLEAALTGNSDGKLASLVILSDGRNTTDTDSDQVLDRLRGLGIPIHTVLVGSELRPRDLAVSHIDHPETIFQDDKPLITTIVQTSGFDGEEVTIFLEDVDDETAAPLSQTVTVEGPFAEVAFDLEDLDLGRHRYRVRMDVAERETREDNNDREFSMTVVDDRAQALILEGEGRWEFRYLDNALVRDERVNVEHVLFEQPYMGVLPQSFFPSKLSELETDPDDPSPFARFDVIFIGDVSPISLPVAQWKMLDQYVREEGGTIVFTAGKRFFPLAYRGTRADALLPVTNLRTINLTGDNQKGPPQTRGFHLNVTPDGEDLPMFRFNADPIENRDTWEKLPGHLWGIVGEAKPGATVWATADLPGAQAGLEGERENGLIVQRYVGTGQVVWIGIDSTWRWRFRYGDEYHHRFWGQLARWAVSFKANAGNKDVRLALRSSVISEGENALVQARWDERFLNRHPDMKPQALVTSTNDEQPFSQKIDLKPQLGNPLLYEASAAQLPAGEYRIQLIAEGVDWGAAAPETTLIVNNDRSPELQDVSSNKAFLEQLAAETGGKFWQLDQLHELPQQFTNVSESISIREEIPLWSHWLIMVLFCTIATFEWITRKLNGLP